MAAKILTESERLKNDNAALREAESKGFARIRELERRLREINREQDTAEHIRETIYRLAAQTPDPPKWVSRTRAPWSSRRADDDLERLALGGESKSHRSRRRQQLQPDHRQATTDPP